MSPIRLTPYLHLCVFVIVGLTLSALTACTALSGLGATPTPAETPTPTPWVLFDPKDANVNWLTQTPTAWPRRKADCPNGICPPTPTPWPLPPADLIFNTLPDYVTAYSGQTIAVTSHFHNYGFFWVPMLGEYGGNGRKTVVGVLASPGFTTATYTHYWLFQALNPGKADVHFRLIDFHCPPPPGECRPMGAQITFEVLPAPSSTPNP